MEAMVAQQKLPPGDVISQLKYLQEIVLRKLPWARLIARSPLVHKTYNKFVGLLASSLYLFSPQGRIGAIASLTWGDVDAMLSCGYVLSTTLKTRSKYGFQPVTLSDVSAELLRLYVESVRPQVQTNPAVTDPLFIKWNQNEVETQRQRLLPVFQAFFKVGSLFVKVS